MVALAEIFQVQGKYLNLQINYYSYLAGKKLEWYSLYIFRGADRDLIPLLYDVLFLEQMKKHKLFSKGKQ